MVEEQEPWWPIEEFNITLHMTEEEAQAWVSESWKKSYFNVLSDLQELQARYKSLLENPLAPRPPYYPLTCSNLLSLIPEAPVAHDMKARPTASHLRWMIREIGTMTDYGKASRWIGWVFAQCEVQGWIDNSDSRALIGLDERARTR